MRQRVDELVCQVLACAAAALGRYIRRCGRRGLIATRLPTYVLLLPSYLHVHPSDVRLQALYRHFSGLGRTIGRVCLCLCIRTITFGVLIWYDGSVGSS